MSDENLRIAIKIEKGYLAKDLVANIEQAGVTECLAFNSMRAAIGRLAVSGTLETTLQNLREVPGVIDATPYEIGEEHTSL